MLVDSHAHLDDDRFDKDRQIIINNFEKDGLSYVLHASSDLQSSIRAVNTAQKYDKILASVGYHPHDAKDITTESLIIIKGLAQKEKVVAIGEIGLDYHYDHSPRDIQRHWFREQVRMARELDMPYIVHDRDAHRDVYDIVFGEKYSGTRGIMHCYSGSPELAKEYIKLGFLISLAGPVTFDNAKKAKEVAKEIPLEYLLVETDSPYLTPVPYRGKRNQPAYVKYVAEEIARIKGISFEEVARVTTANFKRLFKLV
ncbi:MAG: TatD family hydrolase [Tissierellales bacterium]|nr:TatD family hydrolase [Tissierellales bacterium]MBN2827744.1 TatD family hydrolase [Tissierellales bacterium]